VPKKCQGEAMNFASCNPWLKTHFFFLLLLLSLRLDFSSCAQETRMRSKMREKRESERNFRGKKGFIFFFFKKKIKVVFVSETTLIQTSLNP